MPKGYASRVPAEGEGWLPYQDTPRPEDLGKCRFELSPANLSPGVGVITVFAEDYDAAGRVFRWLVGQALQEKALSGPQVELPL